MKYDDEEKDNIENFIFIIVCQLKNLKKDFKLLFKTNQNNENNNS